MCTHFLPDLVTSLLHTVQYPCTFLHTGSVHVTMRMFSFCLVLLQLASTATHINISTAISRPQRRNLWPYECIYFILLFSTVARIKCDTCICTQHTHIVRVQEQLVINCNAPIKKIKKNLLGVLRIENMHILLASCTKHFLHTALI